MHRICLAFASALLLVLPLASGHGMVLDPIARGSRWRCNGKAPRNYDDNGLFCGGYAVQWTQNGGKCGLCGDNYADPMPRTNELSGPYGQGEIVRQYRKGAIVEVKVMITANHRGHFEFNVCNMGQRGAKETDACFEQYPLLDADGRRKWFLNSTAMGEYRVPLQLPEGLVCEHCVLQWTYITGNSWGWCNDQQTVGGLGCGPQENFRTCSDIRILDSRDVRLVQGFEYCAQADPILDNSIVDDIPDEELELDTEAD